MSLRDAIIFLRMLVVGDSLTPAEYALNIQRLRRKYERLETKRRRLYMQQQAVARHIADLEHARAAARQRRQQQEHA